MANKTQAKAAIDGAVTSIKADIDNILPAGVNLIDGYLNFGPVRYGVIVDAGGSLATADSIRTSVKTNLTTAARAFTEELMRRSSDGFKTYRIAAGSLVVVIQNF